MKKNFLYSFILVSSLFSIKTSNPVPTPPPGFDEFMQNVDMDQILKDMEDIFGQIDEKETSKTPAKKTQASQQGKKPASTPQTKKPQEDKETTFKKPFEIKNGESPQMVKKLPKEKREAFQFYMNDFLKKLGLIENKIDSFELGIPFKEELEDLKLGNRKENYKNLINNIRIQHGRVKSKQLYQRGFYLEKHNEVRENIIKALKKLKTLEKEISQVNQSEDLLDTKSLKKQRGLKKDIKQFFTITLPSISEKLTLTTDTEDIKKEIESKKKKREQTIQQAKRKQDREARAAKRRRPFDAGRGRNRTSPWRTGGIDDFLPPWQKGRARPRGYSPHREPTKYPKTDTKFKDTTGRDTEREKDDDKKGFSATGKKNKEITNIIGLKKQIAVILKENIIELLKKDNNALQNILTEKNNLSEAAQSLKLIKQYESKLSEKEIANLENTEEYKKADTFLNEQLKASIPYIITLCKFTPEYLPAETKEIFAKEQKAALCIYEEVLNKDKQFKNLAQGELQKQEKEITKIITDFPKQKTTEIGEIEKIFTELITKIVAIETKVGTAKTQCETFKNATVPARFIGGTNQPEPVKILAQQCKTEIEKTGKIFDEVKKKIEDLKKIKNVKEFKTCMQEINNIQIKIQQIIKSCVDAKNDIKATLTIQNIIISTANDLMTNLEDIQKDVAIIPTNLDETKQRYETLLNEFTGLNAMLNKEPKYKK